MKTNVDEAVRKIMRETGANYRTAFLQWQRATLVHAANSSEIISAVNIGSKEQPGVISAVSQLSTQPIRLNSNL
jgi:hypothetical protein